MDALRFCATVVLLLFQVISLGSAMDKANAFAEQRRGASSMVVLPNGLSESAEAGASPAALEKEVTGHTGHRWCPEAQLTSEDLELTQRPENQMGELSGYCYYLSKNGQSCSDACMEQVAGQCDAFGTEFAAHSVERCQMVVQAFGGLTAGLGVKSDSDRSGCTYSDVGSYSKVQLMKKDDLYPLCSEQHDVARSHRVCACLPTFGDFNVFNETVGSCRGSDGLQNHIRTGMFRSPAECQDECIRDSNCGAFAYVHPWDGNERLCNFYGDAHVGDGSNKHIHCFVKDEYLATIGRCKQHGARNHNRISNINTQSVADCKAACDAESTCRAYEVAEEFAPGGACDLYGDGHTGDGHRGQRCYTKAMGGVSASAR